MVVFGTRPEAIKLALVVEELRRSPIFEPTVVVTGQHREMLDQVLRVFDLAPDHDLNLIQPRQCLSGLTGEALKRLGPLVEREAPGAVVVQGDTTSTFTGALAAFYNDVPVVHVEAGLRTGNPRSPFPEEINRRLAGQLAALHLAATPANRDNLLAEGVPPDKVFVTGNTVIDALVRAAALPGDYDDPLLDGLDDDPRRVLVVTAHRRESWGPGMESIGRALAELARTERSLLIVLPVHRNPAVRERLLPHVADLHNVRVVEPLGYRGFARLLARADIVLTDSGGIQEEAPSLGKPVLVMRDTTERPEAVEHGVARLVGTGRAAVVGAVRTLLHDDEAYAAMASAVSPFGDGRAAERTVELLAHAFGRGPRPEEFVPPEVPAPAAGAGLTDLIAAEPS
jgi:UDP-N-acetylglucosamine 2-epimerase (non-hydrolysing)